MTSSQIRLLAALVRTEAFFKQHGADWFSSQKNRDMVQEVSRLIAKMNELSQLQARTPKPAESNLQVLNRLATELRGELTKVTRTSRALIDEAPQLRSLFLMPRSPGFAVLRKTSRTFIEKSTPEVQKIFIEAELPAEYVQIIQEKLQRLESVMATQSVVRKQKTSARKDAKAICARAMIVLRKLDAAVCNKISDPTGLEKWRTARNVETPARPPRPKKAKEKAPEPEPLPVEPIPTEKQEIPPIEVNPPEPLPIVSQETEEIPAEVAPAPVEKPVKRKRVPVEKPVQEDLFGAFAP